MIVAVLGGVLQATLPDGVSHVLIKSNVECNSDDANLGWSRSAEDCAEKCAASKDCRFFIYGTSGTKEHDCYKEKTLTGECAESFESDLFDFYELKAPWIGCADPQATNYNPDYLVNDRSCEDLNPCVEVADIQTYATCDAWRRTCVPACPKPSTCSSTSPCNEGYRNAKYDTVSAAQVDADAITVDGDLRDWAGHRKGWCYKDVAFADTLGREVVFETDAGGKWYGTDDFSMSWMAAWDPNVRRAGSTPYPSRQLGSQH
jgi:hypothetical protein